METIMIFESKMVEQFAHWVFEGNCTNAARAPTQCGVWGVKMQSVEYSSCCGNACIP